VISPEGIGRELHRTKIGVARYTRVCRFVIHTIAIGKRRRVNARRMRCKPIVKGKKSQTGE
jgi:hypothetical protein